MSKSGIDQDALIDMFAQASAKQGEALRRAVSEATLKALQGRELTLDNIRKVLKTVTQAASAGAAQNAAPAADIEGMLSTAFTGMDAALLQAVEANRKALQQFVDQGVGLQEKRMQSAMADLEKMEDVFIATVSKAVRAKGTDTGAQAASTVEQLMAQTQTALRDSRAMGLRATQALMDSYSALVSGVLIGMSEGLQKAGSPATAKAAPRKK